MRNALRCGCMQADTSLQVLLADIGCQGYADADAIRCIGSHIKDVSRMQGLSSLAGAACEPVPPDQYMKQRPPYTVRGSKASRDACKVRLCSVQKRICS